MNSALDAYIDALDDGDMEAAAAVFSEDAVYARPGFVVEDGKRVVDVLRGRAAIAGYLQKRGKRPNRHQIRIRSSDGNRCYVEGVEQGGQWGDQVFIATATIDDDGLIKRYLGVSMSVTSEILAEIEQTRQ